MATRRTQIVEALKDDLGTIDDVLEANVFRQFKYLEEINDFPSICFLSRGENRLHRGAGRRLAGLQIDIRGYVYDPTLSNEENAAIKERLNYSDIAVSMVRLVSMLIFFTIFTIYS